MAKPAEFFVVYPGELTPDDRAALNRLNFEVYANGISSGAAWRGGAGPSGHTNYQVVRLTADSADDARQQVIDALGREPERLDAHHGRLEEPHSGPGVSNSRRS